MNEPATAVGAPRPSIGYDDIGTLAGLRGTLAGLRVRAGPGAGSLGDM